MIPTANGALAAGIARLSDAPAKHLLIIAEAGDSEDDPPITTPIVETPASRSPPEEVANEEPEANTAPVVGAFSNRRAPAGGKLARWYYKQPPVVADEEAPQPRPMMTVPLQPSQMPGCRKP